MSALPSVMDHADRITSASRKAMSILIVDDEDSMLIYLDRVLSGAGYRTTLAVDGPDAIRAAGRTGRFDLLLTDVHMPDVTGLELVRQLRQHDPLLKVLYLTGHRDRLFILEKPCSAAGLLKAVSLAIGSGSSASLRE